MISEPELVGDGPPEQGPLLPGPPGVPDRDEEYDERGDGRDHGDDRGDRDDRLESGRAERRPPLRAWQWGVVGVVATSLLWAGGLFAYSAVTGGDPDPGPYRAVSDLCESAAVQELAAVHGKVSSRNPEKFAHPAMDQAHCSLMLGHNGALSSVAPEKGTEPEPSIGVHISYTLHRKTDPGPEFDAQVRAQAARMHVKAEPVTGFGERAYRMNEGGGGHALHVLDGQAVLQVQLYSYWSGEESGPPPALAETEESRKALAADAGALLKELRGGRD
ncbi:hypothetical protein ACWDR0_23125 [Streptomyces sp. NPDC003691]